MNQKQSIEALELQKIYWWIAKIDHYLWLELKYNFMPNLRFRLISYNLDVTLSYRKLKLKVILSIVNSAKLRMSFNN